MCINTISVWGENYIYIAYLIVCVYSSYRCFGNMHLRMYVRQRKCRKKKGYENRCGYYILYGDVHLLTTIRRDECIAYAERIAFSVTTTRRKTKSEKTYPTVRNRRTYDARRIGGVVRKITSMKKWKEKTVSYESRGSWRYADNDAIFAGTTSFVSVFR